MQSTSYGILKNIFNLPQTSAPTVGYRERNPPHPPSWLEPQGYQRFPLSKAGLGQNIALHAASADTTAYAHTG